MQYTRRDVVAGLPVLMAFGLAGCKTAKATANNTTEDTKKASEALRITAAQTLDGYAVNSTTADENTILVNTTDDVTITNSTVTKTGDSDGGDNCNFYGQNAAVLVEGGSTTSLTNLTVTSDAKGANGIFSTEATAVRTAVTVMALRLLSRTPPSLQLATARVAP